MEKRLSSACWHYPNRIGLNDFSEECQSIEDQAGDTPELVLVKEGTVKCLGLRVSINPSTQNYAACRAAVTLPVIELADPVTVTTPGGLTAHSVVQIEGAPEITRNFSLYQPDPAPRS